MDQMPSKRAARRKINRLKWWIDRTLQSARQCHDRGVLSATDFAQVRDQLQALEQRAAA